MGEAIYERPADYDLEHEGDDTDVAFYRALVDRLGATRVLELACGSGRLTIPLAQSLARRSGSVTGVELNDEMLAQAQIRKVEGGLSDAALWLEQGDMRSWRSADRFDLVLLACSSIAHLLSLDDQLAVWETAVAHLVPGGRFVVDITMPELASLSESQRTPPRAVTEVDLDQRDPQAGTRLIRQRTMKYDALEQRADIQFLYDKFDHDAHASRFVSDFTCHVFFPRELMLLFRGAGFEVEALWSDFTFRPASARSREVVWVGRRAMPAALPRR